MWFGSHSRQPTDDAGVRIELGSAARAVAIRPDQWSASEGCGHNLWFSRRAGNKSRRIHTLLDALEATVRAACLTKDDLLLSRGFGEDVLVAFKKRVDQVWVHLFEFHDVMLAWVLEGSPCLGA